MDRKGNQNEQRERKLTQTGRNSIKRFEGQIYVANDTANGDVAENKRRICGERK